MLQEHIEINPCAMQNLRQDDPSQKASSVMSGLFAKKVHIFKIEGAQNIRDW